MKKLLTLSIVCALFAFTKVQSQEIQVPLTAPGTTDQSTQLKSWQAPNFIKTVNNLSSGNGTKETFDAYGCVMVYGTGVIRIHDNLTGVIYYPSASGHILMEKKSAVDPDYYIRIPWVFTIYGSGSANIFEMDADW